MTGTAQLLHQLGYDDAPNWMSGPPQDPAQAQNHRLALRAGAMGAYYMPTFPATLPSAPGTVFPAIYVAEAFDSDQARSIRKKLWNLGSAPILLVVLPGQIRAYAGFVYDRGDQEGLLDTADLSPLTDLGEVLEQYHRHQVDSGRIWELRPDALRLDRRIDGHLLANLNALGHELRISYDLPPHTANALIGKFIYIKYLCHRQILTESWFESHGIDPSDVLGRTATAKALSSTVRALEARFGGRVFPFMDHYRPQDDEVVQFVARAFAGDEIASGQITLDFGLYDFSYIPVELLSAVYEQFLRHDEAEQHSGAVYTPEWLADYVLSQLNSVRPLTRDMSVLDPCCGSGVFLVLALRRLIELELRASSKEKLTPQELSTILAQSIFGIERNLDACYVTEFSLILTLLSYIEPPDLDQHDDFRFPELHDRNIVHGDFFDPEATIAATQYDWVVGNPPWLELEADSEQKHLLAWIEANRSAKPVPRRRTGEAFAWRSGEVLQPEGVAGLVLHGKTLANAHLKGFRRAFFQQHSVHRVTNFANLAYVLFAGRADDPACTIVFGASTPAPDHRIIHYGPFVALQPTIRSQMAGRRAWSLSISERETKVVPQGAAMSGRTGVWKSALWGSHRHDRALARLTELFPLSVGELSEERGLALGLGVQLRRTTGGEPRSRAPELAGLPVLDNRRLTRSRRVITVPASALGPPLDAGDAFVRAGRRAGIALAKGPHVLVAPFYAAFSERDFVVKHSRIALSGEEDHTPLLRALSMYLASSIGQYQMFFHSIRWGLGRRDLHLGDVRDLPCPALTAREMTALAKAHVGLTGLDAAGAVRALRDAIDEHVEAALGVPEPIGMMAREFLRFSLPMDKGQVPEAVFRDPSDEYMTRYVSRLKQQLDEFAGLDHEVGVKREEGGICCTVSVHRAGPPLPTEISLGDVPLLGKLGGPDSSRLRLERSVRIIEGDRLIICKPAREVDWTETAALEDSDDVIAEILAAATLT